MCAQDGGKHSELYNEAEKNRDLHGNLGGTQFVNEYSSNMKVTMCLLRYEYIEGWEVTYKRRLIISEEIK